MIATAPRRAPRLPHRGGAARTVVAAALVLLAAAPAFAQIQVRMTSFRSPYEYTSADKNVGYARLEVHNPSARPEDFHLVLGDEQDNRYALGGAGLRPGETRLLHVPTLRPANWVRVTDAYGNETLGTVFPAIADIGALHIYTSSTKATLAKEEALREAIRRVRGNLLTDVSAHGYPAGHYGRTSSPSGTGTPLWETEAGLAPDDWRCYLAFPMVLVAADVLASIEDQPSGLALREWVRTGGTLYVYNAAATRTLSEGAGSIIQAELNVFDSPDEAVELLPQGFIRHGWRSFPRDWGDLYRRSGSRSHTTSTGFPVKIESSTAYSVPVTLSVLFFLVAGPINYFWLRRRGRVKLLFATVPLISAFFCGMIVVAFVFTQGFDRRSSIVSITYVDQRTGWGFLGARQMFYSGMYPGGGFRWSGKSLFVPLVMNESATYDLSAGVHLAGGQFRPLAEMHYVTYRPQQTRERLDIETNADGTLALANGFETDIDTVMVRHGGDIYEARDLRKGDRGQLTRLPPGSVPEPYMAPWRHLGADPEVHGTLVSLLSPFVPKQPLDDVGTTVFFARFVTRPRDVESGLESASDAGSWHFLAGVI